VGDIPNATAETLPQVPYVVSSSSLSFLSDEELPCEALPELDHRTHPTRAEAVQDLPAC
jgi:hypothetical protein